MSSRTLLQDYLQDSQDLRLDVFIQSLGVKRLGKTDKKALLMLCEDYRREPSVIRYKNIVGYIKARGPVFITVNKNRMPTPNSAQNSPPAQVDQELQGELDKLYRELRTTEDPEDRKDLGKQIQYLETEIQRVVQQNLESSQEALPQDILGDDILRLLGDPLDPASAAHRIHTGLLKNFNLSSYRSPEVLIPKLFQLAGKPVPYFEFYPQAKQIGAPGWQISINGSVKREVFQKVQ